jgi:hypothetical protein
MFATYIGLRRDLRRLLADPARFDYTDAAIRPVENEEEVDGLIAATRATATSEKRLKRAAEAVERRRDAV